MNILVAIDLSAASGKVIEVGAALAKSHGAQMTLIHVAPPDPAFVGYEAGPQSVRDRVAHDLHEEHKKLQEFDRELERGGLQVTSLLLRGYPVEKIVSEADRVGAGYIVMGSHGHGSLRSLLVGNVAEGVLRKAVCPVVVVPIR